MKSKLLLCMLVMVLLFSACGGRQDGGEAAGAALSETEETADAGANVEFTVPAPYLKCETQEDLDAFCEEWNYQSAVLDEYGMATVVVTKAQHDEMMAGFRKNLDDSLAKVIEGGNSPTLTNLEVNEDYSKFTVTTTSKELDESESQLIMYFMSLGSEYAAFNGSSSADIDVIFVNADSAEVVEQFNSMDIWAQQNGAD